MNFPKWHNINKLIFDFDGVFTNNKVFLNSEGEEFVMCDRGDGLGINMINSFKKIKSWDLEILVLTKEKNNVVIARCNKIGLKCVNALDDKASFLRNIYGSNYDSKKKLIPKLMYVGNDLNDLEAFKLAEFSCAPFDAHSKIKENADFISSFNGGNGFVRNLIEKLIDIENKTDDEIIQFMNK